MTFNEGQTTSLLNNLQEHLNKQGLACTNGLQIDWVEQRGRFFRAGYSYEDVLDKCHHEEIYFSAFVQPDFLEDVEFTELYTVEE